MRNKVPIILASWALTRGVEVGSEGRDGGAEEGGGEVLDRGIDGWEG